MTKFSMPIQYWAGLAQQGAVRFPNRSVSVRVAMAVAVLDFNLKIDLHV